MKPGVLCLDTSPAIARAIRKFGWEVDEGTLGFCTGARRLPCQIYDKDVFVYCPSIEAGKRVATSGEFMDETPHFWLGEIATHLPRGGVLVAFLNNLDLDAGRQREAYSWIPAIPGLSPAMDTQVEAATAPPGPSVIYKSGAPSPEDFQRLVLTVVRPEHLRLPVRHIIESSPYSAHPLFVNRNNQTLGLVYHQTGGRIVLLPECTEPERVLINFFLRVLPKIYPTQPDSTLVDRFVSPEERSRLAEAATARTELDRLQGDLESATAAANEARTRKVQRIESDEVSRQLLRYHETAKRHEEHAIFYWYKAFEFLEKALGGEKEAIRLLDCPGAWRILNETANASYNDLRHAPDPGEKIREITPEEAARCLQAAEVVFLKYFDRLFV